MKEEQAQDMYSRENTLRGVEISEERRGEVCRVSCREV